MAEFSLILAGLVLTFSLLRLAERLQKRQLAPINLTRKTRRS
jgi:hypothetical protein